MSRRAALGFLGGIVVGTGATAGDYFDKDKPLIEDIGAAERLAAADAMRTLAQQATTSACFLFHGVEPENSRTILDGTRQEFRRNYEAVAFGNLGMNIIGQEKQSDTLALLKQLDTAWGDVDPLLERLLSDPGDGTALTALRSNSAPLFATTDKLFSQISGQYSNPAELIQRDALLIDLAGRQGRLTQEIANHACAIWEQDSSALAKDALASSMKTFEKSIRALRYGLPELGLRPAPNKQISDTLDDVLTEWTGTKVVLEGLMASRSYPDEARVNLFQRMNETTNRLEALAQFYVAQAKQKK